MNDKLVSLLLTALVYLATIILVFVILVSVSYCWEELYEIYSAIA